MEAKILEESASFMRFLNIALEATSDQVLNGIDESGRMRPGGAVDVDDLGDRVWMEQFRWVCVQIIKHKLTYMKVFKGRSL